MKILKYNIEIESDMKNISFMDKLIIIAREHINFNKNSISKQPKKGINNKNKDKDICNDKGFEENKDIILKELDKININIDVITDNSYVDRVSLEEKDSEAFKDGLSPNKDSLNQRKGLINDKLSCSFDSYITIFIFSIYPIIKNRFSFLISI